MIVKTNMPTYKNNSNYRRLIGNIPLEAGQEKELLVYYNLKGVDGVELVDDWPYYSSILVSEKIVSPKIIDIPHFDFLDTYVDRYSIHFYVAEGEVTINFNDIQNKMPLLLYPKAKWNVKCTQRLINRIYISSKSVNFELYLIIEKI